MTEIIRVNGAPGVGKTRRLREHVAAEVEEGRGLNDLYYLTFTRSGRSESADGLDEIFPDADWDDVFKRARTFHGCAWMACLHGGFWADDDDVDQVIRRGSDDDFYRRFASRHGLRYGGEHNPLQQIGEGEQVDGTGDKLFAINEWLTLTRRPIEDYHKAPTQTALPRDRVETLLRAWDVFKRAGRPEDGVPVYEDEDYVDAAIDNGFLPDARVLFIDEFQDLSPQEYLLFKTWRDSGHFDRIYIAGDPNQSIYGFRAGTPMYFEETAVDENEDLKQSWRCPEAVTDFASDILDACGETDPQGFSARRSGGTVNEVRPASGAELAELAGGLAQTYGDDGGVLLLTRANYQVQAISKALRTGGVPYEYLGAGGSVWRDPLRRLLRVLRRMQDGSKGLSRQDVETLLHYAPQTNRRMEDLGTPPMIGVYPPDQVRAVFSDYDSASDIARALALKNSYQTELLSTALEADRDISPDDVRVGTIHASKGLEAPAVLLFDGYTATLADEYKTGDNRAEEHRVYYVGATRASEELYIVRDYFDGPIAPVLPGAHVTLGGTVA